MNDFQGQSDSIASIIISANYWLGFISGIGSGLFVIIVNNLLTIPKPFICGGGGGGSHKNDEGVESSHSHLTIMNPTRSWGFGYNKDPITITHASLVDPNDRHKNFGILKWHPTEYKQKITLLPGENANLYICGVSNGRVYVYKGTTSKDIETSETIMEGHGVKRLHLIISTSIGKNYRMPIKILLKESRSSMYRWHLSVYQEITFKMRLQGASQSFMDGFRTLFRRA